VCRVSVVADAQRGEVYSADFCRQAPEAPLECARETQIEPLASWAARLEPGSIVLGPGLESSTIRSLVPPELLPADAALNYPDGKRLLEIMDREWQAGRRENVWLLEPRYLRKSAAEEKWDSR
jgi:tRNA threonylcarbamoyladenosine biosynthesis protein TsaB